MLLLRATRHAGQRALIASALRQRPALLPSWHAYAARSARGSRAFAGLRAGPQPWEDDYPRPPIKVYEDDFSEDDIEKFYNETITGSGGPPPPGRVQDLITQYFLWDGQLHDDGVYTPQDHQTAFETMKKQLEDQTWCTYGGPAQKTANDGKGWVWLAADMTVVGLCLQIYNSIPYGRRPLLVAKDDDVDAMFEKLNWAKFEERLDKEIGTLLRLEENTGAQWLEEYGFSPDVFSRFKKSSNAEQEVTPAASQVTQTVQAVDQTEQVAEEVEEVVEQVVAEQAVETGAEHAGPEVSATQVATILELCSLNGKPLLDGAGVSSWDGVRERLRRLTTGQLREISEALGLDAKLPKLQKLENLFELLRQRTA